MLQNGYVRFNQFNLVSVVATIHKTLLILSFLNCYKFQRMYNEGEATILKVSPSLAQLGKLFLVVHLSRLLVFIAMFLKRIIFFARLLQVLCMFRWIILHLFIIHFCWLVVIYLCINANAMCYACFLCCYKIVVML